ncbi:MAG: alanine--glyoxylate aminotransferase family protein [Nitrososphaerota archaeon]|nr:alanine--glyoxylate aminotransferase family protein [Nitrososphaerota archaeon]
MYNRARNGIKLLMTAGPVEVSPRVLSALAQPSIYHYYGGFVEFFEETTRKMARVFQVGDHDTLLLQGEGVLGLEASVMCTINPGEKVIVFENGPFGKWFGDYVKNAGARPVYFHEEPDRGFDLEKALDFLEKNRDAVAMTLVHCETPAGLLNPPEEICKKAKHLGMLTIVDCVASLAGAQYKPELWGIDISIAASQKCISSTAGLTPMAISKFAWDVMEKKKNPIKTSYLSLLDWKESWLDSKRFPFTPFTAEVNAISAALDEILEEGLENAFRRHSEVGRVCRKRAVEMGLKLWPAEEKFCSPTVTTLNLPEHMDDVKIIAAVAEKYGILIGGGYRELKGKLLRIGHMGYQAQMAFISATMDALEEVVRSSKSS